jgi:glutamate N-acetyltransferase / amino-acid N-acetyltransferase
MASAAQQLPAGFRAGAVHCGLRKDPNHPDLGLLLADAPGPVAAIYTTNRLLGAHIHLCREHIKRSGGLARAVLVNARNANCATGQQGIEDARSLCRQLAERIDCPEEQVLMASTGPIGAPMPVAKVAAKLDALLEAVRPGGAADFARAIMTTDTVPKVATETFAADAGEARVCGFAKGSGMIHPDMATMLAFLLADAVPSGGLPALLQRAADRSFHRVTIDGDTSPNDTLLLWVRGQGCSVPVFEGAVTRTGQQLARMIARDGEGASRLITVQVHGALDEAEATLVGRTIATSPLVKTAVAGHDPNWGRILAAAGRCGVPFDAGKARVWVGSSELYRDGVPHPEREGAARAHIVECKEVVLGVSLGRGNAQAEVWTCDFTKDYVQINADYRT